MKQRNNRKSAARLLMMAVFAFTFLAGGTLQASAASGKGTANAQAAQAQTTLRGNVVDEQGFPVIGANIVEKGNTANGTVTDLNGNFAIDLSTRRGTILVSYIGYETKEVKAEAGMLIKVSLNPDNQLLEEVVVTGYGTFKKSAYAGSASTVMTANVLDVPAVSFNDILQGAAPGVQIESTSGIPGASTSINIRGMGSFNASSSPLYVIDGVPVISGDVSTLGTNAGLDVMATLNNSDIESMTVIKDAAAASLYGSRAANGVILITTKKGKSGKPQVSFKADWGSTDFAMKYRPVMGGEERREYIYNALYWGAKIWEDADDAEAYEYADDYIDDYAPVPWCGYVDWDDILFKTGKHETYEASISGGSDKTKFFSSISYLKQDGVTMNSGLERINGRMNVEVQVDPKLKMGGNFLFSHINQDVYSEGASYTAPFYTSRNCVVPSDPVYNEDGSWNRDFIRNSDRNPYLSMLYDYKREYMTRFFNTAFAEYEIIKDLKFKTTISYDYNTNKGAEWSDPRTSNGDDENGIMYKKMMERKKLVWANQLSYLFNIGENNHFDALIGYEIDDQTRDYMSAETSNFATSSKNAIANGSTLQSISGYSNGTRLISYLGRVNYDYKSKIYAGFSYRMDGSSRLSENSRWGSFWSVSAAYRMTDEAYMETVKDWLTELKVRASYGINGTLPSDYYGYMGLTSVSSSYADNPAMALSQIANSDLEWEKNANFNIGVDFALFDRVSITAEYYTRTTKDLLMDYPVSMTTGFEDYLRNIGKVRNQGVELEITSKNFQTKDFSWSTTLTLAHNKNKIATLDGIQTQIISSPFIHQVGSSYRTFYVYEFAGINPENGMPMFYTNDVDSDGNYIKEATEELDACNRIAYKHAEPTLNGGFSNTLRYKWFDLSFMFTYQLGGYSYDKWAQKTEHGGYDLEANIPTYYRSSWKQVGDITDYELIYEDPDYPMSSYVNSRRIHSTDFIRLKNLTLGFTLPKEWTRACGLNSARIYASGNNLLTWAKYDYYDPEAVSGGSTHWGTPPLKTYTFGINVNF